MNMNYVFASKLRIFFVLTHGGWRLERVDLQELEVLVLRGASWTEIWIRRADFLILPPHLISLLLLNLLHLQLIQLRYSLLAAEPANDLLMLLLTDMRALADHHSDAGFGLRYAV